MNYSHPAEATVLSVPVSAQHSHASFSKTDTNVLKGLAVCMLLFHHLYMGVLPAPVSIFGNSPLLVFATLSKVCVAVFTLLSGYGLAISYKKRGGSYFKFTCRHLAGLMKRFWLIYLLFFVGSVFIARPEFTPSEVYGNGISGAVQALIEFLSLRPIFHTASLNQTWWYMEAALVLYLFFPILFRLTEKAPISPSRLPRFR